MWNGGGGPRTEPAAPVLSYRGARFRRSASIIRSRPSDSGNLEKIVAGDGKFHACPVEARRGTAVSRCAVCTSVQLR